MKNYAKVLPIIIVGLLALSVCYLSSTRLSAENEYADILAQAREYSENGLVADALSCYQEALAQEASVDVAVEVGEMYQQQDCPEQARSWGREVLLGEYAQQSASYQFMVQLAIAQEQYDDAYTYYAECEDRELLTDEITALMVPILYAYTLGGHFQEVGAFSTTLPYVPVMKDGLWGYANKAGKLVISCQYTQAGTFVSGLAPVTEENGEACYIDANENKKMVAGYLLPEEPDASIQAFEMLQGDIALGYDGAAWNYYDTQARKKVLGGYQGASVMTYNLAAVTNDGDTWMLVDNAGAQIGTETYQSVLVDRKNVACRTQAIIVQQNDAYYLVDQTGAKLSQTAYENAKAFYDTTLAAVQKDGVWLFVDESGTEQNLGTFEEAESFCNGYAAVKVDGLWGYIDTNGTLVIPAVFDDASEFSVFGVTFVKEAEAEEWTMLQLVSKTY